jgi:outer membrane protein assembly factor BamB
MEVSRFHFRRAASTPPAAREHTAKNAQQMGLRLTHVFLLAALLPLHDAQLQPGSPWATLGGSNARSFSANFTAPGSALFQAWRFRSESLLIPHPPVVTNGSLAYVVTSSGLLYAVRMVDGGRAWSVAPGGNLGAPAVAARGGAQTASSDGRLRTFSAASGALTESIQAASSLTSFLRAPWGDLFVGSGSSGLLLALRANGSEAWRYAAGAEFSAGAATAPALGALPLVPDAPLVLATSSDGALHAVLARTGLPSWVLRSGAAGECSGPAVDGEGRVAFAGGPGSALYLVPPGVVPTSTGGGVLSRAPGAPGAGGRWGGLAVPAAAGGGGGGAGAPPPGALTVVAVDGSLGALLALNSSLGLLWAWPLPAGAAPCAPPLLDASASTVLLNCGGSGTLYALSGATGARLWSVATGAPGAADAAPPAPPVLAADGVLLVPSADGALAAFVERWDALRPFGWAPGPPAPDSAVGVAAGALMLGLGLFALALALALRRFIAAHGKLTAPPPPPHVENPLRAAEAEAAKARAAAAAWAEVEAAERLRAEAGARAAAEAAAAAEAEARRRALGPAPSFRDALFHAGMGGTFEKAKAPPPLPPPLSPPPPPQQLQRQPANGASPRTPSRTARDAALPSWIHISPDGDKRGGEGGGASAF